jgi:predicted amidohydrolase
MTYGGLDGDDQISSWLALSDASVEPAWFDTGDELTMFPYHGFKLALMICFECEFPESVRQVSALGADVVLVPTACAWEQVPNLVAPTRAYENGVFMKKACCHSMPVQDLDLSSTMM